MSPLADVFTLYVRRFQKLFRCDRVWDTKTERFIGFRDALELTALEYHGHKSTQFRTEVMLRAARDWWHHKMLPTRFVPEHLKDRAACQFQDHRWGLTLTVRDGWELVCLDPCEEPIRREVHNGGPAYTIEMSACCEPIDLDMCETESPIEVTLGPWAAKGNRYLNDDYEWGIVLRQPNRNEVPDAQEG